MLLKNARIQYVLFAIVAALALAHFYAGAERALDNLRRGTVRANIPFFLGTSGHVIRLTAQQAALVGRLPGDVAQTTTGLTPEAKAAGIVSGDAVLSVNGKPMQSYSVLIDAIAASHAGDTLALQVLKDNGTIIPMTLVLAPERKVPAPLWAWVLQWSYLGIAFICLLTGLYVVFARPLSPHAWLLLGVLAFADVLFIPAFMISKPLGPIASLWNTIIQTAMPPCLMLFGIYFAGRSAIDARAPWLKWVFLVPIIALFPLDLLYDYAGIADFKAIAWIFPWLNRVNYVENIIGICAISYFFPAIAMKAREATGDARRRLNILYVGSAIGLTPLLILSLISLVRGTDLGQDIPRWITLPSFAILLLFPLTLAYVVVVQRAMDVRILIRQGTKYFFARRVLFAIRTFIIAVAVTQIVAFIRAGSAGQRTVDFVRIAGLLGLAIAFRFILSKRLQQHIDQRFFREAYSSEQLLSELSEEARNFTETAPLIDTISNRIATTLHIERIAVFLRSGDTFQLAYATGPAMLPGASFALPASSTTITTLNRARTPANVYRDDPSSWLVDATEAERTALADLSTELLVPVPGRNRLIGVMALGPKRSEEPYSRTDRQLLQTVASQTGMALENAELLENLTSEVAQRERVSREMEIAREVQERLFPQTYPRLPGVDLAGYCRPAQAIGGDYYDFFLLGESATRRLAIALGDISGKGISAALLMASLRASLRSIASLQSGNLSSLIAHVNHLVYDSSTANRYATFFYAEYDPATRLLTYVNAGHNAPYILRDGKTIPLEATGTVVGLLPESGYDQATIPLHPGDVLLAFTDGISEAMTRDDEEWGEERMIATVQQLLREPDCKVTAQQLLRCILDAADTFTAGAPQHDDMTLLVTTIT